MLHPIDSEVVTVKMVKQLHAEMVQCGLLRPTAPGEFEAVTMDELVENTTEELIGVLRALYKLVDFCNTPYMRAQPNHDETMAALLQSLKNMNARIKQMNGVLEPAAASSVGEA